MALVSLLSELRVATREVHEELERQLDVPTRCGSPSGYATLLSGFWAAYAPLESAVTACPVTASVVPDWPQRLKLAWLEQDLEELGVATPPAGPEAQVSGAEDVVGTVYVLEGATLGGAVILRQLAAAGLAVPSRFFTAYGERRGRMWRVFRQQVEQQDLQSPLRRDVVVDAACRSFDTVRACCLSAV